MAWVTVGVAAAGLIAGQMNNEKGAKASKDAREQALAQFANIKLPDMEKQKLLLEEYKNTGVMSPELETLINQGPSSMEGISLDPAMRQKQMAALESMAGMSEGKIQSGDMAAFEMARHDAAAADQAKQGQILQEMQQRGQGGSGAELLARLKSSQSSADRLQQADLEQAKKMQDARVAALTSSANMAGNLRSQDYGEQSNLAKAKDMIAQFNAQNAQNVENRNTNTKNSAQQLNMQNAQNVSNMNTGVRNTQQTNNKALYQQQFNNDMGLAAAKSGQYNGIAQSNDTATANQAAMYGQITQGGMKAADSYFNKQDKPAAPKDDSKK